jgi:hypothetical protein
VPDPGVGHLLAEQSVLLPQARHPVNDGHDQVERSMSVPADDDHRAVRPVNAVDADRTEQHPGERPATLMPHN